MEKDSGKRAHLKKLDKLVCESLIDMMENKEYEKIPSLSVAVQYLKANEQVTEKEKQTANSRHKEMVEEARKRRENGHS